VAAERIPVLDVTVERDVVCRARDGVALAADVYRPAGPGPYPVLLMRDPYDKTGAQAGSGYPHPSLLAARGHVVVVQDCRGRFRSGGSFEPFANEARDGYDAVEWAARLPGADGRVVMYGFSYVGATQLLAATERPPSLVAIMPGFTSSSYYEGWTYEGGALSLAFAASWAAGLAYDGARTRGDGGAMSRLEAALVDPAWLSGLPLDELAPLSRTEAPFFYDWLAHPSEDPYWRATSIREDYGRIQVPGLHLAGWYDVFLAGSVENFRGLAGRQKLVVGPWVHGPWTPTAGSGGGQSAGSLAVDEWTMRFLDVVLHGDSPSALGAPVTAFVLGDGWRNLDAWPPSFSQAVDWHLHSDGQANSSHGDGVLSPAPPGDEPPDVFVYDPLAPSVGEGGHSCCVAGIAPMGPASQRAREEWRDVLVYTSAPLERDVELLGDASVTLHAASSAVDTDFTARLCLVDPAGESINLTEGIVRARYRASLSAPQPLTPWAVEEYRIALGPVGALVPAGHRLRLDVSSSDFPHWDRNLNTGGPLGREGPERAIVATQAVYHDRLRPSRMTLPVLR
jgi:putative CocE/NonD family hydrolase